MRQVITITGLGTPSFQSGVENLKRMLLMFANSFPEDKLNAWQHTEFQTWPAIECYTRYFTEKRLAPQEPEIEFEPMVDPHSVLRGLAGSDFFHGRDNHVEYRELSINPSNIRRYC